MTRTFDLFFMGGEIPGWKKLLIEQGVQTIGLSFPGIERRAPKTKPYLLAEKFPDPSVRLFLDSGGHLANKGWATKSPAEWQAYADRYWAFVEANIDRVSLVTEFDAKGLGFEWVAEQREARWDHLDPAKFVAVWHSDWGLEALRSMGLRYEAVGVAETESATGSNLQPLLHSIGRSGVHLHGVAMTKPDILRVIPFRSASSTSWLSPMKYGDTIVWDGQMLHRYPRDMKERARTQHKMLFERAGFDAEAIQRGDATEVARFTVWSWMRYAESLAGRRFRSTTDSESTTVVEGCEEEGSNLHEGEGGTVVKLPPPASGPVVVRDARKAIQRDRTMLPIIGQEVLTSTETLEDGTEKQHERKLMTVASQSARRCNNCFVADVCPSFQPDHACAFDIPVEAKTAEQRSRIRKGVIEMQVQRVAFLKMAEDAMGGYPDANLSAEMDRLSKLMATDHEIEDDRDRFEMTIKSRGHASTIERIFGKEAPPRHGQPMVEQDPIKIIDAQVPLH